MNSSTTKLLGTLEVLNPGKTFFWETSTQGEFNLWNLMINEGFVNLNIVAIAITAVK
ncbi:MAG: hypothetical protein AAFY21_15575 [Cyanobacteria bacterium J06641_2]